VLDWLPPEFRPFVGVFILAVLFVAVTSLIHKYRLWQADKVGKAQRILSGAQHVEKALQAMEGLVMPREMGDFCRDELLARYRLVQSMFANFEGIQQRIKETQSRHPGRGGNWETPHLESEAQLDRHTAALTEILDVMSTQALYSSMSPEANRELRERIRLLRAETRVEFCSRKAYAAAEAGAWDKAQNDMLRLMGFLKSKAPANERGKELYQQATDLYRHYNHRELPGQESAGPGSESRVA